MLVILRVGNTSVDYFYFTKCIVMVLFLHWNAVSYLAKYNFFDNLTFWILFLSIWKALCFSRGSWF